MIRFIQIPFGTPTFDESIRLRDEILRKPLNMEFNAKDIEEEWDSIHLGGYDEQENLVACLVLKPLENQVIKMRQVAVSERMQGRGIGSQMVAASEKAAIDSGYHEMQMNARETAVPFYLKLGYEKVGKRFTEVGIPHFKMKKVLVQEKEI